MAVVLLLLAASSSCAVDLGALAANDVTITTRVETSTAGHTGTVELSRDGRGLGVRTVSAAKCEDLVEMMALITSMAIARVPAREPSPPPVVRRPIRAVAPAPAPEPAAPGW